MKGLKIVFICLMILFFYSDATFSEPPENAGVSELHKLVRKLKSENLKERTHAAHELVKNKEIAIEKKGEILLEALKEEVENPHSNEVKFWTGYLTETEALKRHYKLALKEMGNPIIPFLKENHAKESGEIRDKMAIALGSLGDASVYEELVGILSESTNSYARAEAIRAISDMGIKDKELIPLYKEALKDDFFVMMKTDLRFPPEQDYENIYYPVREEAFSALLKLGIEVRRDKNEFYIIEE